MNLLSSVIFEGKEYHVGDILPEEIDSKYFVLDNTICGKKLNMFYCTRFKNHDGVCVATDIDHEINEIGTEKNKLIMECKTSMFVPKDLHSLEEVMKYLFMDEMKSFSEEFDIEGPESNDTVEQWITICERPENAKMKEHIFYHLLVLQNALDVTHNTLSQTVSS